MAPLPKMICKCKIASVEPIGDAVQIKLLWPDYGYVSPIDEDGRFW